jgi:hypothetical protein
LVFLTLTYFCLERQRSTCGRLRLEIANGTSEHHQFKTTNSRSCQPFLPRSAYFSDDVWRTTTHGKYTTNNKCLSPVKDDQNSLETLFSQLKLAQERMDAIEKQMNDPSQANASHPKVIVGNGDTIMLPVMTMEELGQALVSYFRDIILYLICFRAVAKNSNRRELTLTLIQTMMNQNQVVPRLQIR